MSGVSRLERAYEKLEARKDALGTPALGGPAGAEQVRMLLLGTDLDYDALQQEWRASMGDTFAVAVAQGAPLDVLVFSVWLDGLLAGIYYERETA